MRDKILEIVKTEGPLLPVEVASKTGMNSFLAAGYLEELVENGLIRASKEKVGSTRLFYVDTQKPKVADRLKELGAQEKTTSTFKKPTKATPELEKKREEFAKRLEEIEKKKDAIPQLRSEPKIEIKPKIEPEIKVVRKEPPLKTAKKLVASTLRMVSAQPEPARPKASGDLVDTVVTYFKDKNIKVLGGPSEINSKESEMVVSVSSDVGPVKFLVKIKDKKKVNKSDLLQAYVEGTERHMPVMVFSNGSLTSTAKEYLSDVGGFIRVKLF